jgi:DNA-binding transcriptional ArsR family regulator
MSGQTVATRTPPAFGRAIVEAHADPVGQRLWQALIERTASAAELARDTGVPQDEVVAQLAALRDLGVIEVAGPADAAGGEVYRAIARPLLDNEQFERLPVAARRRIFDCVLADLERHVEAARATGGFDRPDAHVSWTPLELDERGYREMVAAMDETLERVMEIQTGVVERRAAAPSAEPGVRTEVALLHFVRPDADASQAAAPDDTVDLLRDCVEDLSDVIADVEPDWHGVARQASRLRALADTLARATPLA